MAPEWSDHLLDLSSRVHVRLSGPTGEDPVIVLHDAGAESVDAPAWSQIARTRGVCQVLLPGVGDSDAVPPGADMTWMTSLLSEAIDATCSSAATLVGTSLGGWFAIETAVAHPDSVGGLVLLDAAGLHSPPGYLFSLFADGQGRGGHDGLVGPTMRLHGASAEPAAVAPYMADLTAAALHSWSPHVPDPSLLARVGALSVPTTIMWGEQDALIPIAHGRALAAAIPGATLEVVADAGHLLAVDAPAHVSNQVLARPVSSGQHAS